jgi:hypothetical protein
MMQISDDAMDSTVEALAAVERKSAELIKAAGTLRSGVKWGRAPGQAQLDDDSEYFYRMEQADYA